MIQPQSLRYFAEVARNGSLRQASEIFFVAPSAVSRQIANLEKEFGAELFERSPRGMVLTAAGKILMAFVEESENRVQHLRTAIDDLGNLKHGTVRIALVEAVSVSFLPDLLVAFAREYPPICFEMRVCGTAQIVEAVADHSADIGLAFNVLNRDDVVLHGRIVQPLQVICRPDNPLADRQSVLMRDLADFRVALPDRSFGIRYLIERAAAEAKVELAIAYEVNSLQAIKNIVRRSDVVGFMPPLTLEAEAELGVLKAIPLAERACEMATIDVITSRNRKLPDAAAAFLKHVLSRLRMPDA